MQEGSSAICTCNSLIRDVSPSFTGLHLLVDQPARIYSGPKYKPMYLYIFLHIVQDRSSEWEDMHNISLFPIPDPLPRLSRRKVAGCATTRSFIFAFSVPHPRPRPQRRIDALEAHWVTTDGCKLPSGSAGGRSREHPAAQRMALDSRLLGAGFSIPACGSECHFVAFSQVSLNIALRQNPRSQFLPN